MARSQSRSGNGWWWLLGIGGLLLLGSTVAAKAVGDVNGDGNQDIKDVIDWLNGRFGKEWVRFGIDAVAQVAPAPYNILLPLVFQVEQEYLGRKGMGDVKRERAKTLRRQRA